MPEPFPDFKVFIPLHVLVQLICLGTRETSDQSDAGNQSPYGAKATMRGYGVAYFNELRV